MLKKTAKQYHRAIRKLTVDTQGVQRVFVSQIVLDQPVRWVNTPTDAIWRIPVVGIGMLVRILCQIQGQAGAL